MPQKILFNGISQWIQELKETTKVGTKMIQLNKRLLLELCDVKDTQWCIHIKNIEC